MPGGRLFLVVGLPGAGKTNHARVLEEEHGAVRLSPDEWMDALGIELWDGDARARIERLQWDLATRLLGLRSSVIIEWGTWARAEREALLHGARAVGAAAELHVLDPPIDVLFERLERRAAENPPIARGDLERWSRQFERPTADERSGYDRVIDLP